MAATAALIPAPPMAPVNRVGRLLTTVTVNDGGDPHIGLGVVYERDLQVNGTATWPAGCATPGSDKVAEEISDTVTGIPFAVYQMAKCRMLNEWDTLGGRLDTIYEAGEQRTVEEAFATALAAGDYGTVSAGPAATDDSALAVFAAAEQYLAENAIVGGFILASPEVVTYAISRHIIVRNGDRLESLLGTPVIALVGLDDDVYVTGQITVWRSTRFTSDPVQISPYNNEFTVLAERVYTIAVETIGDGEIVNWTVDLAA